MKTYPSSRTRNVRFGFKGYGERYASVETMDPQFCSSAFNFAFESGCLTGNIGVDVAKAYGAGKKALPNAPLPILDIFHYRFTTEEGAHDDRLVARLSDFSVWYLKLFEDAPEWKQVANLSIRGEQVQAVNYNYAGRDRLMFCSKSDPLFILDDITPMYCPKAPSFSCFTIHSERLFGGVNGAKTRLWFSDDFDPLNWTVSADEAGYITFDDGLGDIIGVTSFLGYLYIFREYGIFRLTAFGKQSEFSLKKVYADTGRIIKNSVAFCGDRIIFMAGDCLYDFDGYSVRRITKRLPSIRDASAATAACLDGYYWLACKIGSSPEANNVLIRYEIGTDTASAMRNVFVKGMQTVRVGGNENIFMCFLDEANADRLGVASKSGMILGAPSEKSYLFEPSSLGTSREKTVRYMELVIEGNAQIILTVDNETYTYDIKSNYLAQRVPVGVKGRMIGLRIKSESGYFVLAPINMAIDMH